MSAKTPPDDTEDQESLRLMTAFCQPILRGALGNPDANLTKFQLRVICCVAAQSNVLFVARTGAGKSASYFLATRLLRAYDKKAGPTIVLSPLLSLVRDQCRAAETFGLKLAQFHSGRDQSEKAQIVQQLRDNAIDVLFTTPESLAGRYLSRNLNQFRGHEELTDTWTVPALVVLDEAHVVTSWGHDFRPAFFSGLKEFSRQVGWWTKCSKLATSATVPNHVERDIEEVLGGKWVSVRGDLWRSNMRIRIVDAPNRERVRSFLKNLFQSSPGDTLVFVRSKSDAEETARFLRELGVKATAYHSSIADREEVERKFKKSSLHVVVSTIALAMGFDKANIDTVVHLYVPPTASEYYQMIGRAGRQPGRCTAYLLGKKPWSPNASTYKLLGDIIQRTQAMEDIDLDILRGSFVARNCKERDFDAAVEIAFARQYLLQSGAECVKKGVKFDSNEWVKLQGQCSKDAKFMSNFFTDNKTCKMAALVDAVGGASQNRTCKVCSACAPELDNTVSYDSNVAGFVYYRTTTPKGVPVLGIGMASDERERTTDNFQTLLQICIPDIGENPPSCALTCVPSQRDCYKNVQFCKKLAADLRMPFFKFVTPNDGVDPVRTAQNTQVAAERAAAKFTDFAKDGLNDLPKCVAIVDDSVKTGSTIDTIAKPLIDSGKTVFAIVDIIFQANAERHEYVSTNVVARGVDDTATIPEELGNLLKRLRK